MESSSKTSPAVDARQLSPMEKLPDNVLELIFSRLRGRDLLNAALVSKHLLSVALSCGTFSQANHFLR